MRPVAKSSAIDNVGLSVSSGLDPETNYRHAVPVSLLWKGADIELHDVHFQYPTRKTPVLQGLSLKIRHGQFAAIVGPSGSGKTTIISLLERFYEPQRGSILYDGEDIMTIPLSPYRTRISLVAQEPYLFRGTIKENVLLGADPGSTTEEQLHAACSSAGLHTFIASLPLGYLTPVGNAGVALSGGQKQRISIARALIRDPAVLLLDEATSSLDSETEREVQAVFEKTRKGSGRTMIVVAHRLATVQNADVIFVMDKGRVVERGSHGELVGKRGVYWKMVSWCARRSNTGPFANLKFLVPSSSVGGIEQGIYRAQTCYKRGLKFSRRCGYIYGRSYIFQKKQ
jgi:ATP-binding cassette subfamily B (MDR/TAP) protein 1